MWLLDCDWDGMGFEKKSGFEKNFSKPKKRRDVKRMGGTLLSQDFSQWKKKRNKKKKKKRKRTEVKKKKERKRKKEKGEEKKKMVMGLRRCFNIDHILLLLLLLFLFFDFSYPLDANLKIRTQRE